MPLPSPIADDQVPGTLYVVATPIGNLDDITLRALKILESVDMIAAEDTRHTKKLLAHFSIEKALFSLHEHNERDRCSNLVARIRSGHSVALVSDAGTPSVSDPGFRLTRLAIEEGIRVVPVPGVSAAIAALSASGLPTDSFAFLGFPPRKQGKRRLFLKEVSSDKKTLIFYESPHRIMELLEDMIDILGPRNAVLAREMTKLYEEFVRGTLDEIRGSLLLRDQIRGECTLIVGGAFDQKTDAEALDREIHERIRDNEIPTPALAKELARKYGLKKQEVYEKIIALRNHESR